MFFFDCFWKSGKQSWFYFVSSWVLKHHNTKTSNQILTQNPILAIDLLWGIFCIGLQLIRRNENEIPPLLFVKGKVLSCHKLNCLNSYFLVILSLQKSSRTCDWRHEQATLGQLAEAGGLHLGLRGSRTAQKSANGPESNEKFFWLGLSWPFRRFFLSVWHIDKLW